MILHEAQRTELRKCLNPHLVVKARHVVDLYGVTGDQATCPSLARLLSVGVCRRDEYSDLLKLLRTATEAVTPVVLTYGVDTQAVEQNWRLINRHKAILRHTGPEMYLYLLHRLAHLVNLKRWMP